MKSQRFDIRKTMKRSEPSVELCLAETKTKAWSRSSHLLPEKGHTHDQSLAGYVVASDYVFRLKRVTHVGLLYLINI